MDGASEGDRIGDNGQASNQGSKFKSHIESVLSIACHTRFLVCLSFSFIRLGRSRSRRCLSSEKDPGRRLSHEGWEGTASTVKEVVTKMKVF